MFKRMHQHSKTRHPDKGFSLVELVVVVVILAVLAAIAVPTFLNQKKKASDAVAQANAEHMSLFMQSAMRMKPSSVTVTGGTAGTTNGNVIIDGVETPKDGTDVWVSSPNGPWCLGAASSSGKAYVSTGTGSTGSSPYTTVPTYSGYSMCASENSKPKAISDGVTNYNAVPSGLVLYADAGNIDSYPGSGNNVNDLSGNNTSIASYVNPLVVSNGAFDFTASNTDGLNLANNNFASGVGVSSSPFPLSDFTMESVFQVAGTHQNYNGTLLSSGNWNNAPGHWSFGVNQANTAIVTRQPSYTVNYTFNPNTWYDVVWRRTGNTVTFFVNNTQVAQYTAQTTYIPLTSNATNTGIGRETYANGYFNLNGKIGLTKIYNRGLTNAELTENFKTIRSRFGI